MKSMIERVARAIALQEGVIAGETSDFADWHWEEFIDHARDVLAAIREPTASMMSAAHNRLAGDGAVEDVYRAMIDAALGEVTK